MNDNKPVLVYRTDLASNLLKTGHRAIKILPNFKDPERKRSVIVFQWDDEIDDAISEFIRNLRHEKQKNWALRNVVLVDDR